MKIALIQPNLDKKHISQRQAYGSANRPPETGLAALSGWIKEYSAKQHEVIVLNPAKSIKEIANEAAKYDLIGITDWFSNHDNCVELAKKVKSINPNIKIVFGGPNASMIPNEILNNCPCVDYVIYRDGEDALLAIAEGKPIMQAPNTWFRGNDGKIKFTYQSYTELEKMPVWDFSNFQDLEERLSEYLKIQKAGLDPWLVPPLTLFSFRGCMKAIKEGVCYYCTSSEEKGRALPPEKLWKQIMHLNQKYGAEIFYMCDDIFPVTPARVKAIAEAKPPKAKVKIRAYAYLPDLAKLDKAQLEEIARNLKKIGVFNLFFGSENYCPEVLAKVNKRGITAEETIKIIKTLNNVGNIKTTIAIMLGLPGESQESLELNLNVLKKLLESDCIERLYISIGMPLKGTAWCKELEKNADVLTEYAKKTGKNLFGDDSPDYTLLSKLSIKYMTSTNLSEINEYLNKMIDLAKKKMPEYRIGGFLLDLN